MSCAMAEVTYNNSTGFPDRADEVFLSILHDVFDQLKSVC